MDKVKYRKELLKPAKKHFEKRKVHTFYKNDIWSADLIDYQRISKKNSNTKYILLVIDIYSRYVWLFPLKNKEPITVLNCFKTFEDLPTNLWTDRGSEFINKNFKKWCVDNEINLYHTGGESKAVFAERAIKTIRHMINEYMVENNTEKYISELSNISRTYNGNIHSSIGVSPYEVYYDDTKPLDEYTYTTIKKPVFQVGDYVRISRVKGVFEKGFTPNWSEEVFKVISVDKRENPVMYQIEDLMGESIEGKFYKEELQKTVFKDKIVEKVLQTKTVKGVKMILVKYRGYDNKFNEWIKK